jgi:hypothetical protein
MDRREGFSSRRNSSTGSDFEIPFAPHFGIIVSVIIRAQAGR